MAGAARQDGGDHRLAVCRRGRLFEVFLRFLGARTPRRPRRGRWGLGGGVSARGGGTASTEGGEHGASQVQGRWRVVELERGRRSEADHRGSVSAW
jgi:hypothetical protein